MRLTDRRAPVDLSAAKGPGLRRGYARGRELRGQLFLASRQPGTKRIHIDPGRARLRENPGRWPLFFADMVLDLFGEHLDLAVVELLVRTTGLDFGNQDLGAVMLHVTFVEQ